MIISHITRSPHEFSTSTTVLVYPSSIKVEQSTASDVAIVSVPDVATSGTVRSPRNGRQPLHIEQAELEASNLAVRARMRIARTALSTELDAATPDSLAKLRLRRGMSQTQLAQAIGTSQPHIAKIESGSLQLYWNTATKIADALAVSLDEIRPLIKTLKTESNNDKPMVNGL